MENNFKEEVIERFSISDYDLIGSYIDKSLESTDCPTETINKWECSVSLEKHDALNISYHFEFRNEENEKEIHVSFYTGIDVGCEMVDFSFEGQSVLNTPNVISVFSHIEIDWDKYLSLFKLNNKSELSKIQIFKVENLFRQNKNNIEKIINDQNYDNYHTGGGSIATNNHYKEKLNRFKNMKVFWNTVYKEEVVDRNII